MAWIEVHQSLPSHRKIKRLKRTLKIKTAQAVGHVVMLWLWALDNAPEGRLDGLDPEDLAEAAEWQGDPVKFVDALRECGFVDEGESLLIHDWQEYGGRLQDQRKDRAAQNRERQKRYRDKQKEHNGNVTETQDNAVTVTDRNANVTRYGNVTETQDNTTTLHNTTLHYISPPSGGDKKGVTRNVTQQPQSRAVCAYLDMISPTPSSSSMRELMEFEKDMGSDVCLRAIDEALDANARSWPYIKSILKSKREQGVKSIQDWDRLNAERIDAKHRNVASKATEENQDAFRGPADLGDNEAIFAEMEGWK